VGWRGGANALQQGKKAAAAVTKARKRSHGDDDLVGMMKSLCRGGNECVRRKSATTHVLLACDVGLLLPPRIESKNHPPGGLSFRL